MGHAASELATGFGWARMARQYIDLYRQLAGQRDDPRDARGTAGEVARAPVLAHRETVE